MSPSKLTPFLTTAFRARRKILLAGAPGVGKSDIIDHAASDAGADIITRHPSIEDPTDAKGLPALIPGIGKGAAPTATHLPFGDLQRMIDAQRLTVVHLEDFGQAVPAVQAAYMQLLLRRAINGTRISDHIVFCASTNDTSHRAGVNPILEPVKSRFDAIITLETSLDDWCAWALGPGDMPSEIVAFIRFRPNFLTAFEATRELKNSPSPRTIAAAGRWIADGCTDLEIITGAAGAAFAAELLGFLKIYASLPSIDSILLDPTGTAVPREPSALYAIITALQKRYTHSNSPQIFTYAQRLPKEFEICLIRDIIRTTANDPTRNVAHTPEFTRWATNNGAALS